MSTLKRIFLCLFCLLLLPACGLREENKNGFLIFTTEQKATTSAQHSSNNAPEVRACWLSYLELNPQKLKNKDAYRSYLESIFQPLHRLSITDLFVQVRPFADAIYPSVFFEPSVAVTGSRGSTLSFDYLALILEQGEKYGMRIHAWLNPYRVLSAGHDLSLLGPNTPLAMLIQEEPDILIRTDDGVFLQPASIKVQKLILNGVRELLTNYPLTGIHIDDYFYPQNTGCKDDVYYQSYLEKGGTLKKDDWRRAQISALLRGIYRTVHNQNSRLVFSVSPCGSIDDNQKKHFADVASWCSEDGFCDWIIPQLYYGFSNEKMPFEKTAGQWKALCTNKNVCLIGGLALYKTGKQDPFAGSGKNEWLQNDDVPARQIQTLRRLQYHGFALYSAQFVNFQRKACQLLETVL